MTDCDHLPTTTAYFDGVLESAREAAALEHLATCAICQGALGDAVAIDAAASTERSAANVAGKPARARWPLVVAIAGGLAAAAAAIYVVWPREKAPDQVALVLPRERAIEARFTGERFAPHRPYAPLRGTRALEAISFAELAKLEQRRETADLIAALVATGNVDRAKEITAQLPAGAATESDRAAVALAADDTERALDHAYRATALDPNLAAAWWNVGLGARARKLPRVARAAFQRVVDRAEPGWADEARTQIAELDREIAPELEYTKFIERAKAMIAGGPLITPEDVRRFPAFARVHVLDTLRVSAGPRLEELRPLARELDAITTTPTMMQAIDRAAAANPALRAKFADRYRAVIARTASADEVKQLIDDLMRAGRGVDDIRAGVIVAGNQVDARLDELTFLAKEWSDPWIGLVAERVRIKMLYPSGDVRAIPALTTALDTCTTDAWSLRCGQVAQELASQLSLIGRAQEAEGWARRAVDWYRRGVAPTYIHTARTLLGDIHRNLGRSGLARAELEEVTLATEATSCALRRHASIAIAYLDFGRRDWAGVRTALPPPVAEKGCETMFEIQALGTAVDLARATKLPEDTTRAQAWIDASATFTHPDRDAITLVAKVRLARGADAANTKALREYLAQTKPSPDAPWPTAIRVWGFATLMADAGARGDYADVLDLAKVEHGGAPRTAACAVVISLDEGELTIAARTDAGVTGDHRTIVSADLAAVTVVPPSITKTLAACRDIAVHARPPLHGRPDLLPAELPWWFAGDARSAPAPTVPGIAVEVIAPRPPDPTLPPLPDPGKSSAKFDRSLAGPEASPARVLAALAEATYVEIHAHGVVSAADDDAAFLALSPDPDGTFALRAASLRKTKLSRAPVVVLAACRAAAVAPIYQMRWSLPDALLLAGASAVVAVDVPIPDAAARPVFDELHRRIDAGESVHAALAQIRAAARAGSWERRLMIFE